MLTLRLLAESSHSMQLTQPFIRHSSILHILQQQPLEILSIRLIQLPFAHPRRLLCRLIHLYRLDALGQVCRRSLGRRVELLVPDNGGFDGHILIIWIVALGEVVQDAFEFFELGLERGVVRAQALEEGALGDEGLIDGLDGSAWAVRGLRDAGCREEV